MDHDWGAQFRGVIGNGMRRCRLVSRLSRAEVAQALTISEKQYVRYERGLSHPSSKVLMQLTTFLDIRPHEISKGMSALIRAQGLSDTEQERYDDEPAMASRLRVQEATTEITNPRTLSALACLTEFLAELDGQGR